MDVFIICMIIVAVIVAFIAGKNSETIVESSTYCQSEDEHIKNKIRCMSL